MGLKRELGERIYGTGIYKISFKNHEYFYIGLAQSHTAKDKCNRGFYRRWKQHLRNLRKKTHVNVFLQRMYNKYGYENIKFSIVEECPPEHCPQQELYWFNMLKPQMNFQGNRKFVKPECSPITDEYRRKLSKRRIGYKHSEETKQKISIAHKGKKVKFEPLSNDKIEYVKQKISEGYCITPIIKGLGHSLIKLRKSMTLEDFNALKAESKKNNRSKITRSLQKRRYTNRTKELIPKVIAYYKSGYIIKDISNELNVNKDLVGKILKLELNSNVRLAIQHQNRSQAQIRNYENTKK